MSQHPIAPDTKADTVLLLSAEDAEDLDRRTRTLAEWMKRACDSGAVPCALPALAAALRDKPALAHRRAVFAESWQDAAAALADSERQVSATALGEKPKLIVSLPGQGTLRPGVLARLFSQAPLWAGHLERLGQLAQEVSGFDYAGWLGDARANPEDVLGDNGRTQLAIFCVGVSLARWLGDLGVRPDGYIGHSLGEWMGACLAGVLTDEHTILAVHHRGRLMQATGPGAALIVRQPAHELLAKLPGDVELACINAPNLCLVSGRPDAIARYAEQLGAARIVCRPAPIRVAVHSPIMDGVVEPFRRELGAVSFRPPQVPLLSPVTGAWLSPEEACNPEYWAKQLRARVGFDAAAAVILAEPCVLALEIGMGSALTSLVGTRMRNRASQKALALFGRDEPPPEGYDLSRANRTLAELWASGIAIDLVGEVPPAAPLALPF